MRSRSVAEELIGTCSRVLADLGENFGHTSRVSVARYREGLEQGLRHAHRIGNAGRLRGGRRPRVAFGFLRLRRPAIVTSPSGASTEADLDQEDGDEEGDEEEYSRCKPRPTHRTSPSP